MVGSPTCNQEVAGSIPGRALMRNDSGQVVHTHVPLSPSSVNFATGVKAEEVTAGCGRGVVYRP